MECLEKIIGLSNRECNCVDSVPAEFNESQSGLYIDDMFEALPIFNIQGALNCEDEIWNVFKQARTEAIRDFSTDLIGEMAIRHKSAMNSFLGIIGDTDAANKILTINKPLKGAILKAKQNTAPSAMITVEGVGLFLNKSGTYTVNLYNQNFGTPLKSWTLEVTEKVPAHILTTPINLPFGNKYGQMNTYYFVYESQGSEPFNVKFHCGCSTKPVWTDYLHHGPYQQDTLVAQKVSDNKPTNGVSIYGKVTCGNSWLCSDWDYANDSWARTMAKCLQHSAILKTLQYCINTDNINKFTLLNDEEDLSSKMDYYITQIQGRMNYLTSTVPSPASGCWQCKPKTHMATIYV
jgi:hypothetical protein